MTIPGKQSVRYIYNQIYLKLQIISMYKNQTRNKTDFENKWVLCVKLQYYDQDDVVLKLLELLCSFERGKSVIDKNLC